VEVKMTTGLRPTFIDNLCVWHYGENCG